MIKEEIFPIVDESGIVIGSASRKDCHSGTFLLHPVVHLHVFDERGRLFLQHRSLLKDIQPGKWDTSVGGHIDYGEEVIDALFREAREELGLQSIQPIFLYTYINRTDKEAEYVNTFATVCEPSEIIIDNNEITDGRFFDMSEIEPLLGTGYFTPNFELEFQKLKDNQSLLVEHFDIRQC